MNARIYSWLLQLYPAELREDFGPEMMQVFLDDMEDSRQRQRFSGATRVWWRSLKELCQIALPAAIETPGIAIPVFMYCFQTLWACGLVLSHAETFRPILVCAGVLPSVTTFIFLKVHDAEVPDPTILTR